MLYSVKQNKKGLRRLLLLLYQVQCILQQYILYTSKNGGDGVIDDGVKKVITLFWKIDMYLQLQIV